MPVSEWWLYVIRADHNKLYTGVTTDIDRRYAEHLSGGSRAAKSLRGCDHLELVFHQRIGDKAKAHSIERRFKALSKKLREAVVCGRTPLDIALSSSKKATKTQG